MGINLKVDSGNNREEWDNDADISRLESSEIPELHLRAVSSLLFICFNLPWVDW